jgi:hypothetical protein
MILSITTLVLIIRGAGDRKSDTISTARTRVDDIVVGSVPGGGEGGL